MNYLSPEYGQMVLSKFPLDPIIRDHSKIEHCKGMWETHGIMVLGYSSDHRDMNVRIMYLPSNRVAFEIEMFEGTIIHSVWKDEEVDETTYEYFSFIVEKIFRDIDETKEHLAKFKSKYWVERNKKLSQII